MNTGATALRAFMTDADGKRYKFERSHNRTKGTTAISIKEIAAPVRRQAASEAGVAPVSDMKENG